MNVGNFLTENGIDLNAEVAFGNGGEDAAKQLVGKLAVALGTGAAGGNTKLPASESYKRKFSESAKRAKGAIRGR